MPIHVIKVYTLTKSVTYLYGVIIHTKSVNLSPYPIAL